MRSNIVEKVASAAAVLVFAAFSAAPAAYAATYSTSGTAELFSLGDQMGQSSDYDQLAVNGVGGAALTNGTILLNTLDFTAGVNAYVPSVYNYSFAETMTVNNGGSTTTQTLNIPFSISINYADTLTILGGTTLSYLLNGTIWDITVDELTIGPNPGGSMFADLLATVSDPPSPTPLPSTLALFVSGLGVVGLVGLCRKKSRAVAAA